MVAPLTPKSIRILREDWPPDARMDISVGEFLATLDDLYADAQRWRDAEAEGHTVDFTETGFGLQHPPSCRPDLIGCAFNAHLAKSTEPAMSPGRYRMTRHEAHFEYAAVAS